MTGWLMLLLAAAVAFLTAYLPLLLILSPALWAYAGARTKPYLLFLPAAVFAAGTFALNPLVVAAGLSGAAILAAALLYVLLTRGFSNSETVLLLCGVFLVGLYTAVCLPGVLEGRGAFADIQASIASLNNFYHSAAAQMPQLNPDGVKVITEAMDAMYDAVPSSFVAVLCIFASVLGLANLLFFRLFCRKQTQISLSPMRAFRDWTLPRSMTLGLFVMLIISLVMELAQSPFAEGFGVTANVLLAIPLFLQGISVVDFFIVRAQKNVTLVRTLTYVGLGVLYQFVLYPLVLVGCFDQIFRLRDRMRGMPPRAAA
mgnify:CR=1 FL=1